MQKEILVDAKNLSRYYSRICAVNDVSFELAKGDVLGFLGPNGAGKSSTMQMITGNLAPTAGQILVNGIDLIEKPKQAKLSIGYLPEQPPVYRELTVDEYLEYCARLNRIVRSQQVRAVATAKDRCGLGDVGRRLIGNLSKGFQQRVGIAQAILHSPAVVVLDEPTVGLDPIQIREIRKLIRELGEEHGIILSTHILPEVQATCNRVQIIHEGRLVFADTLDSLQQQLDGNSLVAAFHGQPDMGILSAIPGVTRLDVASIETMGAQRLRIHFDGADPSEAIVEQSVTQGWRLFELSPEHQTLEQIFIDLTCSEDDCTTDNTDESTA